RQRVEVRGVDDQIQCQHQESAADDGAWQVALRLAHLARRHRQELPAAVRPQGREHRGAEAGNAAVGAAGSGEILHRARAAEQEDPKRDAQDRHRLGRSEDGLHASAEHDAGAVDRSEYRNDPDRQQLARTEAEGERDAKQMYLAGKPLMTQGVNVGDEDRHGGAVCRNGRPAEHEGVAREQEARDLAVGGPQVDVFPPRMRQQRAELGALLPHAGGEYVYLRTAYGEIPGFLFACNAFVLGGAAVAAYGAAVAIFISDIHPLGHEWLTREVHLLGVAFTFSFGARQLLAIGVIAVFAAINCAGVMLGGRVQSILTAAKAVAILGVALGVFLFGGTGTVENLAAPGSANGGIAGFGAAMFAALWAYSGWQFLPMAAGEVREPQRNLPRAIIGGTLLVLALYLIINTAYLYALPIWQVSSANSTAYPEAPSVAARAVQTFLGGRATLIAALIFLISTIGSLNGVILSAARVPYAAARDGLFFAGFGRLSPGTRVPVTSLV